MVLYQPLSRFDIPKNRLNYLRHKDWFHRNWITLLWYTTLDIFSRVTFVYFSMKKIVRQIIQWLKTLFLSFVSPCVRVGIRFHRPLRQHSTHTTAFPLLDLSSTCFAAWPGLTSVLLDENQLNEACMTQLSLIFPGDCGFYSLMFLEVVASQESNFLQFFWAQTYRKKFVLLRCSFQYFRVQWRMYFSKIFRTKFFSKPFFAGNFLTL